MRIGIIGTENSHVDHFVKIFNCDQRYDGYRVVALAGGHTDRNQQVADAGHIDRIVEKSADLVGLVDTAIVCSRDGRLHYEQALPLLEAGLPLFIDKPLTCDVTEAEKLLARAQDKGLPIMSSSSLRWEPAVAAIADRLRTAAVEPTMLTVRGRASSSSEYGGLWFYGIHVVEIATALLPGRPISRIRTGGVGRSFFAHGHSGETQVLLEFMEPGPDGPQSWTVTAAVGDELIVADVPSTVAGADDEVAHYVEMLRTGAQPLSDAELLASIATLQSIAP